MASRGNKAASGAASGAAAGTAVMPGWGTAIGAVVGGIGGYLSGDDPEAPPPQALPGPAPIGAYQSDLGGWWRDPITGQITQTNWNFDPSRMGSQLDAEMMWNSYMGRGNESQVSDLDWQIRTLQQNLERLSSQGSRAQTQIPSEFQDIQRYIDPDGKLHDISDTNAISQGRDTSPQAKALLADFPGSYGSGNRDMQFGRWVRDHYQRAAVPQYEKFKKYKDTNLGNIDTSSRAVEDLKNQIQYLTSQRDRVANYKASENPLDRFSNDLGSRWQAEDNTNPWADEWGALTGEKIAGANDDPYADMERFGLGSGEGSAEARLKALLDGHSLTPDMIDPNRLQAPEFDGDQAARLADAMNWRSSEEFKNQGEAAEATAARRGMLNSSVLDMSNASRLEGLVGSQKDAALKGAMLRDQLLNTNFGQRAQANSSYQNAISSNNQARNAFNSQGLQGIGLLNSMGQQNYGNWLQGRNQNFQQAASALDLANKMRSEDRSFDVQDYGFGRQENETEYSRANDMWNRLQGLRQQNFGNTLNQSNALAGQAQGAAGINMGYVNMGNQANVANTQMRNAWEMGNQQRDAASDNANQQGWWNLAGSMAGAMGNYYANRQPGAGSADAVYGRTVRQGVQPVATSYPSLNPANDPYATLRR